MDFREDTRFVLLCVIKVAHGFYDGSVCFSCRFRVQTTITGKTTDTTIVKNCKHFEIFAGMTFSFKVTV